MNEIPLVQMNHGDFFVKGVLYAHQKNMLI
jgi:hypothetical protein